jgi:hypothetical protein
MNTRKLLVLRRSAALLGLVAGLLLGALSGCTPKGRPDSSYFSGKVTSGGAPLGPLVMHLHYSTGSLCQVRVREDGTFSIGDLPQGTVKVTFHGAGPGGPPQNEGRPQMSDEAREQMEKNMGAGGGGPPAGQMEKMRAAAAKIPTKYTKPEDTPESVTITEGSTNKNFDLPSP